MTGEERRGEERRGEERRGAERGEERMRRGSGGGDGGRGGELERRGEGRGEARERREQERRGEERRGEERSWRGEERRGEERRGAGGLSVEHPNGTPHGVSLSQSYSSAAPLKSAGMTYIVTDYPFIRPSLSVPLSLYSAGAERSRGQTRRSTAEGR